MSARETTPRNSRVGVILGTLGRQGNPRPMEHVYQNLKEAAFNPFVILMSEVMPAKLNLFQGIGAWVQFACPRLSIDWGDSFIVPILTSYEAMLLSSSGKSLMSCRGTCGENCLDTCPKKQEYSHPMDYYAFESCGPHTPNHAPPKPKRR